MCEISSPSACRLGCFWAPGPSCPASACWAPGPVGRWQRTAWVGMKMGQKPLPTVIGLLVSVFSFTPRRFPSPSYCIWCTLGFSVAGRVSGSSLSQMELSDTGYLSLWFWMNSAWCTAAAPGALSQLSSLPVAEYSTFLFLTSCRTLDYYLSGSPWSLLWMTSPPLITVCVDRSQFALCNRFKPCGLCNFGLWVNVTVVKYWYTTIKWLPLKRVTNLMISQASSWYPGNGPASSHFVTYCISRFQ